MGDGQLFLFNNESPSIQKVWVDDSLLFHNGWFLRDLKKKKKKSLLQTCWKTIKKVGVMSFKEKKKVGVICIFK